MIDRKDTAMEEEEEEELQIRSESSVKNMNTDSNNNDNNHSGGQLRSSRVAEKYGLRPRTIIRRIQLERTREELPTRSRRETTSKSSKIRPPPLSKYRRKTANARERHRMKEINNAFETLRKILPDFCSRRAASAMTKITTLKLAVNYIRALSHILEDGHPGDISFFDGLSLHEVSVCSPEPSPSAFPSSSHAVHFPVGHHFHQVMMEPSSSSSSTSSPATVRASLGSNSDLSDLLSDDSCVFEDNLDAFDDIPTLSEVDAFSLLMVPDGTALATGS